MAQQPRRKSLGGWLGQRPITDAGGASDILRQELRALGYVEGKNIAFEYRSSDNKLERLPALAAELVRLKVDVIVAPRPRSDAKESYQERFRSFSLVERPSSRRKTGRKHRTARRQLDGLHRPSSILAGKRLELLKETIPKLFTRGGSVGSQILANSEQAWRESEVSAKQLGLQLHSLQVDSASKLEGCFQRSHQRA